MSGQSPPAGNFAIDPTESCVKNAHFHYTAIHVSWLKQVDIWLTLAGRSLKGASFACHPELIARVDGFVAAYKNKADPFISRFSQSIHLRRVRISQGPQSTPDEVPDPAYPL
jgi:hypothetical protein